MFDGSICCIAGFNQGVTQYCVFQFRGTFEVAITYFMTLTLAQCPCANNIFVRVSSTQLTCKNFGSDENFYVDRFTPKLDATPYYPILCVSLQGISEPAHIILIENFSNSVDPIMCTCMCIFPCRVLPSQRCSAHSWVQPKQWSVSAQLASWRHEGCKSS